MVWREKVLRESPGRAIAAEIEFVVGGREVQSGEFTSAVKARIYAEIRDRIAEKLRDVKCSEHGEFAKVTAEGQDFSHLQWTVSGCCESLRQEAIQVLRS